MPAVAQPELTVGDLWPKGSTAGLSDSELCDYWYRRIARALFYGGSTPGHPTKEQIDHVRDDLPEHELLRLCGRVADPILQDLPYIETDARQPHRASFNTPLPRL